ncbi:hypothetical protein [Paenibacillus hamazuiensis]|uniref:hypothetical protein n=1 Tax=Paenibacillus hamazuiensis TaxID=2936508 RepID=UPI00200E85B8|nr:hypothetical protein [Paenibacillus hamazuiensis]
MQVPKGYLKFAGWMLLIGGLMGTVGQAIHLEDVPASVDEIPSFLTGAVNIHVLLAFASTFILMGLPAVYLIQAHKLKWWNWLGFPLLFIGLMLEIFHGPVQIISYPIMFGYVHNADDLQKLSEQINNLSVDRFPLQLLILIPILPGIILGILLLGINALQAKVFPKAAGIVSLVVLALLIVGFFITTGPFHNTFMYVHLIFVTFGGFIVFGRIGETRDYAHINHVST